MSPALDSGQSPKQVMLSSSALRQPAYTHAQYMAWKNEKHLSRDPQCNAHIAKPLKSLKATMKSIMIVIIRC